MAVEVVAAVSVDVTLKFNWVVWLYFKGFLKNNLRAQHLKTGASLDVV
jgi:hypothetical protein